MNMSTDCKEHIEEHLQLANKNDSSDPKSSNKHTTEEISEHIDAISERMIEADSAIITSRRETVSNSGQEEEGTFDTTMHQEQQEQQHEKKESFLQAATSQALRPFVIISSSYLLFTITDGAIRMIVLLHAYTKSFSALQVAIMFTLYELAGVVTNLAAGFLGARWGIKYTLISGLALQLFSYGLLFGWKDDFSKQTAIIYVTIAQMFAGIAKDLTKLGGKTVTKLVTPDEKETKLFKLVSLLTGWKNSLKGVGYFLGSALLQVSYETALGVMMGLIVLAMPWAILGLDKSLGTAKNKNATLREVFTFENTNLTLLSLARLFLFASRDFWFEVPLPFFLRSPSCQGLGETTCELDSDCGNGAVCNLNDGLCQNSNSGGGCGGLALSRVVVGAFLGGYIILYGQVQSWTPQLVTGPLHQTPPNKLTEVMWGMVNCVPTLIAFIVLMWAPSFEQYNETAMIAWMIIIIITFAVIFAVNSSIHSFLVVNYASKEKVAVSVGLYYMSNAFGRLMGTLGSGFIYTYVGEEYNELSGNDAVTGLAACFLAGTVSSLIAALVTTRINDQKAGLMCGSCWTIVPAALEDNGDEAETENVAAPDSNDAREGNEGKVEPLEEHVMAADNLVNAK